MAKRNRGKELAALQEAVQKIELKTELEDQRKYIQHLRETRDADLKAQREFTDKIAKAGGVLGLVDEKNFVESMRDVGYKSTGFALAELVDNSIQAGAENIHIIVHCDQGEQVSAIAIMDDGHGMDKEMISESVRWGGTHRHDKRDGFGRFGHGKPSACVSQGRRFTSFSKTAGGELNSVEIDLDEIASGVLSGAGGHILTPPPKIGKERPIPKWVREYRVTHGLPEHMPQGTVVIIEKIDRADFKTRTALSRHLSEHMGVIYRYFLTDVKVFVNGAAVGPIDPLFTLPGHRDPDAETDSDRAEDAGMLRFEVFSNTDDGGKKRSLGWVKVRFARMDPNFPRVDKTRHAEGENGNYRWTIMRNWNKGLQILRKGRQIDVVEARCPWTTFVNYDRYWGCEIDFDPGLDEEFRVTTSKQQAVLTTRMWHLLEQAGVYRQIVKLRAENKKKREDEKSKNDPKTDGNKPSEKAAAKGQKYATTRPGSTTDTKKNEGEQNTERETTRRSKASNRPKAAVADEVKDEIKQKPYKFEIGDFPPGSPFFACEFRLADGARQVALTLNRNHAFYSDLYAANETTPAVRAGLEVLLFAIAEHMTQAGGDKKVFYGAELAAWSQTLEGYLHELRKVGTEDPESATDDPDEPDTKAA